MRLVELYLLALAMWGKDRGQGHRQLHSCLTGVDNIISIFFSLILDFVKHFPPILARLVKLEMLPGSFTLIAFEQVNEARPVKK